MSVFSIPQTPISKKVTLELPLEDIPSSFGLSLNGAGIPSKSTSPSSKTTDPGLLDPEAFRRLSVSTLSGLSDDERTGRSLSYTSHSRYASRSPAPPITRRAALQRSWRRSKGLFLVSLSQLFGALMNVTTRLLELEGKGMHPFQVLFVRMGVTMLLCFAYMWYKKVPSFPLGKQEVRTLLLARGFAGFFGIFGMYYSLLYLPLADATVITFLAPGVAGFACYILIGECFTRIEQIASLISLLGVILIARPASIFHLSDPEAPPDTFPTHYPNMTHSEAGYDFPVPTSSQRLGAIGVSLIGVVGAAGAFTTIRWIGKRAHPLISVNYFAVWCTCISAIVLATASHLPAPFTAPEIRFALPGTAKQWGMLAFLGTCGFIMQFLMTAGLAYEKSNRATNMVYTNMLFALMFDRWVFGTMPGVWSLLGSALILGSAVYVALQKSGEPKTLPAGLDEERGMLDDFRARGGEAEPGSINDIRLNDIETDRGTIMREVV